MKVNPLMQIKKPGQSIWLNYVQRALHSQVTIASARLAYQEYKQLFSGKR